MQQCSNDEGILIAANIEKIYSTLNVDARTAALDIISRFSGKDKIHNLARGELGYAYEKLKSAHAYLLKVLILVEEMERGSLDRVGDTFSIEKQFDLAFKLLEDSKKDKLD